MVINKNSSTSIFFIRHGESENNIIEDVLIENKNKITKKKMLNIIKKKRKSDPNLTTKGVSQSKKLGRYLKKNIDVNKKFRIYTSPFKRALDTTYNLLKPFKKKNYEVIVHPEIFENGGVYYINSQNKNIGSQECLSSSDIYEKYGYNVDLLLKKGPWYNKKWENEKESMKRVKKIVKWIKSIKFKKENYDNLVIFVMHADFINDLQKKLLNINDSHVYFDILNTSFSCFELHNQSIKVDCISNVEHLI